MATVNDDRRRVTWNLLGQLQAGMTWENGLENINIECRFCNVYAQEFSHLEKAISSSSAHA